MASLDGRRSAAVAVGIVILALVGEAGRVSAANDGRPHREDHGALIVLDLYGTYEEMGRQEVELLGAEAREVHELYADRWGGLVRAQGMLGRFVNAVVLPVWASFGGWREDSGFFDESAGIARGARGGERADRRRAPPLRRRLRRRLDGVRGDPQRDRRRAARSSDGTSTGPTTPAGAGRSSRAIIPTTATSSTSPPRGRSSSCRSSG